MSIFKDRAEKIKWCDGRGYQIPLIMCLSCSKYPCPGITREDMDDLLNSCFVKTMFAGFKERKAKMLIFKNAQGKLELAPDGFSLERPDMNTLQDIEEVYVVSKILIKQTRLVVKNKDEREMARNEKAKQSTGKRK